MKDDDPTCAELSAKFDTALVRMPEIYDERNAQLNRVIAAYEQTIQVNKRIEEHANREYDRAVCRWHRNRLDRGIRELDPGHRGSDPRSPAAPEDVTRLEGRLAVVTELSAWRIRLHVFSAGGLARFGLTDDVLVPARESIAEAGGVTAEHDAEMGRPRRLSAGPNVEKLGRSEATSD